MKPCSKILLRPLCFLILLGLSSFMIFKSWCMTKKTEHHVALLSQQLRNLSFSEIENAANYFLIPLNVSASNLERTLSSSLNQTQLSTFNQIRTKIAPSLFLALKTIPDVSHVSYFGLDGLLFLYYKTQEDQTFAVYSNTSYSSSKFSNSSYYCYTQPVDRDTGDLYGEAVNCDKRYVTLNITNKTASSFSSLGREWGEENSELLFLYNVKMDGRGLISMGYPVAAIASHYAGLKFYGGDLHLATSSGVVIVQSKLKDTHLDVLNGTVLVETINQKGDLVHKRETYSCRPHDEGRVSHFVREIRGEKHIFYCSILEVGGIESVYVLSFPTRGVESIVHKNSSVTIILLVLMLVIVAVSVCAFIFMIVRGARREMFLCAALVKQMESTQQAERKSMNKTLAFANASHDIRASLAAISGLIDHCRENAETNTNLVANLVQMNDCTKDLVGILNSVLDKSKIEAGKMQLEEEEFNVAQLLEDVVDMFYPLGMKKGVDVVLDPCDCSILKFNLVRGDRGKLKQILSNLLSNATKFTEEGHISVRAMVRKTSIENAIIASNRESMLMYCLSRICNKSKRSFSTLEGLEENPNCMEYIFDVDDTGKGIPKERRQSVFENFVQVKDEATNGQGTGLGLGIVQSLVRLMGGEIKIIDKEQGERGTCFHFNVFLTACHPIAGDIEEEQTNRYETDIHHRFGMHLQSLPPQSDGSHVILLLSSKERRKICKRLIQSFGIRVSAVKRSKDLLLALERIKQSASSSSEVSVVNETSRSILVVIDRNAGPISELYSALASFRKNIQNTTCNFVWLENPLKRNGSEDEEEEMIEPPPLCDRVLSKPLHGSHLFEILEFLPEFRGHSQSNFSGGEIHEVRSATVQRKEVEQVVSLCEVSNGNDKPLSGKNVLLVEDNITLRMIAKSKLCKLGATVHISENGKEAFDLVCDTLKRNEEGTLPFDYIFMDCKMPVLDGFEATRMIRKEEQLYGIHTPIIAVTAYSDEEGIRQTTDAGMDFHLVKPLKTDDLLKLIQHPS